MDIKEKIQAFIEYLNKVKVAYWEQMKYNYSIPPTHEAEFSTKWCKVFIVEYFNGEPKRGSIVAFIALQDGNTKNLGMIEAGNIYKPASYNIPAKHARGNVFKENFGDTLEVDTFGSIVYLR